MTAARVTWQQLHVLPISIARLSPTANSEQHVACTQRQRKLQQHRMSHAQWLLTAGSVLSAGLSGAAHLICWRAECVRLVDLSVCAVLPPMGRWTSCSVAPIGHPSGLCCNQPHSTAETTNRAATCYQPVSGRAHISTHSDRRSEKDRSGSRQLGSAGSALVGAGLTLSEAERSSRSATVGQSKRSSAATSCSTVDGGETDGKGKDEADGSQRRAESSEQREMADWRKARQSEPCGPTVLAGELCDEWSGGHVQREAAVARCSAAAVRRQ